MRVGSKVPVRAGGVKDMSIQRSRNIRGRIGGRAVPAGDMRETQGTGRNTKYAVSCENAIREIRHELGVGRT